MLLKCFSLVIWKCYSLIYPFINYGLLSWGNTYVSKLSKLRSSENRCVIKGYIFCKERRECNCVSYLFGILKLDNVLQLKIGTFVCKILEENNVPAVFDSCIDNVSAQHSHNTWYANRQNLIRPKARTNYGIQTFKFISSQVYDSINPEMKRYNSVSIFKKINSISNYFTDSSFL